MLPEPMNDKLNILILDNDTRHRALMAKLFARMDGVGAVATAANGKIARAKLHQMDMDLILLDMEQPETEATQTLRDIRQNFPHVGVIALSEGADTDAGQGTRTLGTDLLDIIPKKELIEGGTALPHLQRRFSTLFGLCGYKKSARLSKSREKAAEEKAPACRAPGASPAAPQPAMAARKALSPTPRAAMPLPGKIEIVVIGASTGGPNALGETIPRLPGNLGVPILLVQHMPVGFTGSLAANLDERSHLTVREAVDGELVRPNIVYVAPGGKHLVVRRENGATLPGGGKLIGLSSEPPENSVRPSADALFRSVAEAYAGNILAVIMTGMGSDGVKGVRLMKNCGCYCLSQSEDSCVVYGMPRAVDEANLSDEKIPLGQLAERIVDVIRKSGKKNL